MHALSKICCAFMCRSCRTRLEAHNARQRERWTAAGGSRRRARDYATGGSDEGWTHRQPLPSSPPEPQHPQPLAQSYAAARAYQARAAFAALLGVQTTQMMPPISTAGQVCCAACSWEGDLMPLLALCTCFLASSPSLESCSLAACSHMRSHVDKSLVGSRMAPPTWRHS